MPGTFAYLSPLFIKLLRCRFYKAVGDMGSVIWLMPLTVIILTIYKPLTVSPTPLCDEPRTVPRLHSDSSGYGPARFTMFFFHCGRRRACLRFAPAYSTGSLIGSPSLLCPVRFFPLSLFLFLHSPLAILVNLVRTFHSQQFRVP